MRLFRAPVLLVVQLAETNGVHDGDGPRTHRKDVAQNSADTGRRALKRLYKTGMVVRFDFERDRHSVADVDDARVLARALATRACFG